MAKKTILLSIETSCDDTCISIFEITDGARGANFELLANNSNSQINIHRQYGGVYPVLAKREHAKNLPIILEKTLRETSPRLLRIHPSLSKIDGEGARGEENPQVDLIAVTSGPGLEMCLWEGIVFAQQLAKKWGCPVVPVNHMEGHIFSPFAKGKGKFTIPLLRRGSGGQAKIKFPVLSLLVSGGHTELVFAKKFGEYEIAGETVDDAVGEAFDKVARMLGLPYPGGPEISKLAEGLREKGKQYFRSVSQEFREKENQTFRGRNFSAEKFAQSSGRRPAESPQSLFSFSLPRPMLKSKDFNFSFSGLKTAVLYLIRDLGGIEKLNQATKQAIALEFENAAVECLVYKTAKAVEKYKVKTLIVGGGVSGNKHLQNELKKVVRQDLATKKIKVYFPSKELSTDNSIMIGVAGYFQYLKKKGKLGDAKNIKADGNLRLA